MVFLNPGESFDVDLTFKILHNDFYEGQEFLFSLQQFSNPEGDARERLDLGEVQGNVDFLVKLSHMPEVEPQKRRATMPEGLVSKSAGILLYPNPTEKTLLIQKTEACKDKVQIQIVDVTGRVFFTKQFEQMNTQPVEIGVGDLAPGMYRVVLRETGGKTWQEAFIKK